MTEVVVARTRAGLPADLADGPVVIKAWAQWCSSCRALARHVGRAATASGVPVHDLRVDADPDNLVERFGVRSVPTLIGLHDGIEVARLTGTQPVGNVEALFTTTKAARGSIVNHTPLTLVASRAAAGTVLAAAGTALDTSVLIAAGAVVIAWALVGLVRWAT